jgi:nitroreductase
VSVAELLKARISIRAFQSTPISQATVYALLDAARWAPSGGNLQPWKVVAVSGRAKEEVVNLAVRRMLENPSGEVGAHPVYPEKLTEPYRSRRFKIGEDMYALLGIGRENKPARLAWFARNYAFFGAPVGLFFIIDRKMGHGQWAHLGMFMQSLALAAQDQGLATCMQESWAMLRDTLHEHFALPQHEMIYCGMALGYADTEAPVNSLRSDREPVEGFATFAGFEEGLTPAGVGP